MRAFKLFKLRKDGSLGSLFINARARLPIGEWLEAEFFPREGYKARKGWHCTKEQKATHLTTKGRVWALVDIKEYEEMVRPESQGGIWYLAKKMKILKIIS